MCNDYRLLTDGATLFKDFSQTKIKIRFSEGKPNLEARDDIKITDTAPIVRAIDGEPEAGDLVQRRWSWPGQKGKPVYNFRSEGREFGSGRCLIPADGFYEFTDPADKKKKCKDKWLFTTAGERGSASPGSGEPTTTSASPSPCWPCRRAPTSRPTMSGKSQSSIAPTGPPGSIPLFQRGRS
jgi:putative SOS response-associated peptidase YedK